MIADKTMLLWPWLWRLGVTAVILMVGAVYVRGWWRCRHRAATQLHPSASFTSVPALVAFISGLTLLSIVLVSPMNRLATEYFFVRVTQHLLLIAWVPGLLLVANPVPAIINELPDSVQRRISHLFASRSAFRHGLRRVTAPGVIWIAFVACFWFWYDPAIHQATLQYAWVRYPEMLSLLIVAMLYWWHITGAAPHIHEPMPPLVRVVYTLAGAWPIKVVGLILLFTRKTVYEYPAPFHLSGLVINDQGVGGIIVWILGGIVYSATATILMRRWLSREDEKPSLPESAWATDEAMLAPGFGRQAGMRQ